MNVLIVVPWDQEYGGVASVVRNLAEQLRGRGHGVQFLHPGESSRLRRKTARNGFPAWELDLRAPVLEARPIRSRLAFGAYFGPTLLQLLWLIRRERISIVNLHYPLDRFVWLALCRALTPIRLVTSIHGADLVSNLGEPRKWRWALNRLFQSSDAIVAPSQAYLAQALASRPGLHQRSVVIHNALDLSVVSDPNPVSAGADEPPFILTVAQHNEKKALDMLLAAFDMIASRYPALELHLVGDGPLRPELEAQADRSAARSRIRFLGTRPHDEVVGQMRRCRLFVLPSRSEPFGIAALEALACGRPVVASRVGGLPEFIQDGVTGLLVPPDRPDRLAAAIVRLLDDATLAKRLGAAGALLVREGFGSERAGQEYETLFTRLLAQGSRTSFGD